MNIKASLLRKLGPLPAWAWLAVLAGVLVVYRRFNPGGSSGGSRGDVGAAAAGQMPIFGNAGDGGGGSGDQAPTAQQQAEDLGPGTPVVYDPLGDSYALPPYATNQTGDQPAKALPPYARTHGGAAPPTQTPKTTKKKAAPARTAKPKAPELISEHGAGQNRPASSRGQRSGKRKRQEHRPASHAPAHPAAASRGAVLPKQGYSAATSAPVRAASSVSADAGARRPVAVPGPPPAPRRPIPRNRSGE